MAIVEQIMNALEKLGATGIQMTQDDANQIYEQQHRITWIYEGRSYELKMGLVQQHGSISK